MFGRAAAFITNGLFEKIKLQCFKHNLYLNKLSKLSRRH
jgi:hypothetical protein